MRGEETNIVWLVFHAKIEGIMGGEKRGRFEKPLSCENEED